MNQAVALERMLEQGRPLIGLLTEFPGAHSLHSRQAEAVSRGQWNLHALGCLVNGTEAAIQSGKGALSDAAQKLYGRAIAAYESASKAEKTGITVLGYAPTLYEYQAASR